MKPYVLVILDGWGIAPPSAGNAVSLANTQNFNRLWERYPHTILKAAEDGIGLWEGHQGSSEIGHLIMGAGRNVLLPQAKVYKASNDGSIFGNDAYLQAVDYVKENNSTLHLIGMVSDKGVHSYDITCHRLLELAAQKGIEKVFVHAITDGRDTEPRVAKKYIQRLEEQMDHLGVGRIATVMGRYWAMDRDHRWERVEKAYNTFVYAKGDFTARTAEEAIDNSYKRGDEAAEKGETFIESDEFIKPTVIVDENGVPLTIIKDNDAVIWFNFRVDRAIEITKAFVEPDFNEFPRNEKLDILFVCTTEYYKDVSAPVAFTREDVKNCLGEVLSKQGLKQIRIAETEKWVYLTTIFNGIKEEAFEGEKRVLIPSDKIATYDLQPKMKAIEIGERAAQEIRSKKWNAVFVNFANPDILGHTGNIQACVEGLEAVDRGLGKIVEAVKSVDGALIVTADHGDTEEMLTPEGRPNTHHTTNDVPFILVSEEHKGISLVQGGAIRDVAPTMLKVMGIQIPKEMTGRPLF